MKRVLAIVTALAMMVSLMTVAASAEYSDDSSNVKYNTGVDGYTENVGHGGGVVQKADETAGTTIGTSEVPVKVTVGTTTTTHVYAVSIDKTELSYTYGNNMSMIWNPAKLAYDVVTGGDGSNWTKEEDTITVTNHSDLAVDVVAEWQAAPGHTGVSAEITAAASGNNGTGSDSTLKLKSALMAGGEAQNTERTGTFTVVMSGTVGALGGTQSATIGTITLTIKVPTT